MSLPMINFKATNTEISDHLKDITENKLASLDKFIGDAPVICDVEFKKITNHHQNGNIHGVEINLEINGKLYRAEATAESFEKAIDEAKGDLHHELHSRQGKQETMVLRGARRVKEMMRFGW
jgi:ribosomal subunit interface protein